MAARRYPGVTALGHGRYRIRTEVRHPKTGRAHEIDRKVQAPHASAAATILASERAAWLKKRGHAEPAGPRRLGEAMRAWLEQKRPDLKPSTASTYGTAVAWWTAALGDYLVHAIEPRDVREALAGAREGGDAPDTVDGRLRVLRTFAREERCHAIVEGVSIKRDVRTDERIEDEGRGLELGELRSFLAAGPRLATKKNGEIVPAWRRAWALVATMAWTGMRFGEASALEWKDVDLAEGTIRVRRAQWRGQVGHVKAKASRRTIVLPEDLIETLRDHREWMLRLQRTGADSALVFPSRRSAGSGYVTNGHARKAIMRVCVAAGIALDGRPAVHFTRHTWNNLVRQNADELVRRALIGHEDDESGERYSHVVIEEKRSAVGKVVRMIKGG